MILDGIKMETVEKKNLKKGSQKKIISKTFLLIFSIIILIFLFGLLNEFGATPLIIILIFLFAFLVFSGPFFFRRKQGKIKLQPHYSQIFPSKRPVEENQKKTKVIDLDVKYQEHLKPLIRKCSKCGMILPTFVKKCPNCSKQIII